MFIKYDEYDLLEFFEAEPNYIFDKETGKLMYVKEDKYGMKMIFHMDVYEQTCSVSINYREYASSIIEYSVNSVASIIRDNVGLKIYGEAEKIILIIHVSPNMSVTIPAA